MDEAKVNMAIRKFLKEAGVTSQRQIEALAREQAPHFVGTIKLQIRLTAEGYDLDHVVEGEIDLG